MQPTWVIRILWTLLAGAQFFAIGAKVQQQKPDFVPLLIYSMPSRCCNCSRVTPLVSG
jgi:hypothetical protein